MSEFKFACPVCGQHITADSKTSGTQLECPTCYRKIVVPQPATESKFVLTASEANKPRPPQPTIPTLEPIGQKPNNLVSIMLVVLLVALGAAGATVYALRGKIFKTKNSAPSQTQSASNEEASASRIITNNVAWSLDLSDTNFSFPEMPVAGKIHGEFAECNRNTLTAGALSFRQATRGAPDVSVTIHFAVTRPEDLGGRSINVATNDSSIPRVAIRWKEGSKTKTQWITNDYALRLETSAVIGNRVSGKIYLCLPDENQTRIAGLFRAEIKKPSPPKPRKPQS
jgi:DNA-directed RNA polymerase subunit RPC12/RpoP